MRTLSKLLAASVVGMTPHLHSAAAREADWTWLSMASEAAKWGVSQGSANVAIVGGTIKVDFLFSNSEQMECRAAGSIQPPATPKGGTSTRPIRAKVLCYGTEMDEEEYTGKLTRMKLGLPGSPKYAEVIYSTMA